MSYDAIPPFPPITAPQPHVFAVSTRQIAIAVVAALALAAAVALGTQFGHGGGPAGPGTTSTHNSQWNAGYKAGMGAVQESLAEGDDPFALSEAVGDRTAFCRQSLAAVGADNDDTTQGCVAGITSGLASLGQS